MAQIVNKLNLNRVPQLVDNHSLIFAKNVRLSANGFSPDYGFDKINNTPFRKDEIVGVIPYNTKFYILLDHNGESEIKEYDETTGSFTHVPCNWHYNDGEIDGYVCVNLHGDTILTIAETGTNGKLVPLKVINLSKSDESDNESLYTQAPQIPLFNLVCHKYYNNVIPAGVYQFFIRYEIRKDFYTNWIPVSKELYAGTSKTLLTNQGELKYIDKNVDSNLSFILEVERVFNFVNSDLGNLTDIYKRFQLGFIISHDDEVYARAYKHYPIDTVSISFDYDTEFIEELDVKDLLENIYDVYNVGNLTAFKNKLYIANYNETDFNAVSDLDSINDFVKNIDINITTKNIEKHLNYLDVDGEFSDDLYLIKLKVNDTYKPISELLRTAFHQNRFRDFLQNYSATSGTKITIETNGITVTLIKQSTDIGLVRPNLDEPELDYTETHSYFEHTNNIDALADRMANTVWGISTANGTFVNNKRLPQQGLRYNIQYYIKTEHMSAEEREGYQSNWARFNIDVSFDIDITNLSESNSVLNNINTLIPYQTYRFYVHLVRDNGETTNGFLIGSETITDYTRTNGDPKIIYPNFTFNKDIPEGYVSCFISIAHVGTNVSQIFNIHTIGTTANTVVDEHSVPKQTLISGDCLELDTRLRTELTDIPAIIGGTDTTVDYLASYDSNNLLTFGSSGKCIVKPNSGITLEENDEYGFIKTPYVASEDYIQLVKCTGYLRFRTYGNSYSTTSDINYYDGLNLLGFLCSVKKLRDNITAYISGSDIYSKKTDYSQNKFTAELEPLTDLDGISKIVDSNEPDDITYGNYHRSKEFIIYSNYNLNYLSLSVDINPRFVTKTLEGATFENTVNVSSVSLQDSSEEQTNETQRKTYILLATESLNLSEIYELKSMFYSYTRKTFMPYNDYNVLTRFDNTIRSSELIGDEDVINMFKFRPTDYYNVPTDKGIIINLVAVGDNILVHTQDSIYKFTGYNSLTAAGGEDVQMKESEPFDTGIQELFGSEFGYAGLQNKKHQVLSEMGYTFYDSDGQRIYYYTGNANIKVISDDVSKLFKYKPLKDIYFADDYYNNRVFVCLDFGEDKYVTLTYDFTAKCFISLHDFHFNWAFKTKTKCYFITPERNNIYRVSDTSISDYPSEFAFIDKLYPTGTNKECIIDVIYNDDFESIKTLNAISWVCNRVKDFLEEANNTTEDMLVAEEWFDPKHSYKGEVLRIYSDSVKTPAIDIAHETHDTHDRSNDYSIQQVASYDRPRYNLGKWTFNYFRNILNRDEDPTHPRVFGEQDTLLYGKYFVARFIFNRNTNFKIEDVTFEISNDYNV